jgi:hypothetical protein
MNISRAALALASWLVVSPVIAAADGVPYRIPAPLNDDLRNIAGMDAVFESRLLHADINCAYGTAFAIVTMVKIAIAKHAPNLTPVDIIKRAIYTEDPAATWKVLNEAADLYTPGSSCRF